jgi:hypothetical protein
MGECLRKIAGDYLEEIDLFTESVAHCESHGIRDKGTVTHHQYLLLGRPREPASRSRRHAIRRIAARQNKS